MQFRFPKPLEGWRAFFGEVGIIVLGVLIALGAGQIVDAWQWRQQVRQADELFRDELDAATANAYMQLAVAPCFQRRLDEISAKLNEPAGPWQGMVEHLNYKAAGVPDDTSPVAYHGSSGFEQITTEAWSNALSSGTINHLPFLRGVMLSRAYAAARQLADDERQERLAKARLSPLASNRLLDANARNQLLQAVALLRRVNADMKRDSTDVLLAARQSGLGYTRQSLQQGRDGNNDFLLDLEHTIRGDCVKKPQIP
jgi:hypothetical protein